MTVELLLDLALVALLLGLAFRLLGTRDLFQAIVLFVAFGLTLALAWVRLGAPDIALAEAAVGAGVTGALLLNAYRRLLRKAAGPDSGSPSEGVAADSPVSLVAESLPARPATGSAGALSWGAGRFATGAGLLAVGCGLGAVYLSRVLADLPAPTVSLPQQVADQLDASGVSNPVTAVLLNFRAYDTLLEVAVLVVAVVAVWGLGHAVTAKTIGRESAAEPVLEALVRTVVPLVILAAVYLTWIGSKAPGGAFQAGALLSGAAVLLLLRGFARPPRPHLLRVRLAITAGLAIFLALAAATLGGGGRLLEYRGGGAYVAILLVEAVLAVSIAAILAELFIDMPAAGDTDGVAVAGGAAGAGAATAVEIIEPCDKREN